MRVLIVSDTHRKNDNYLDIVKSKGPFQMVIHCGDVEGSEYTICEAAGCPVEMVMGNNDFFSNLPREKEFTLGKYKIWLTHGHNYYVYMDNQILKKEARARGVDIVMYGHTHKPVVDYDHEIIAVNPGSITYPRQEGRKPSYVIMETDQTGEAHFTIHYIE